MVSAVYIGVILVKLTVVGGCHVIGFPVGIDNSFAAHLEARLSRVFGHPISCSTLPYLKVSQVEKLKKHLEMHKADLVVLQLGHFEASEGFAAYVRKWIKRRRPGTGRSRPIGTVPSVESSNLPGSFAEGAFRRGLWYLRSRVRKAADYMFGHRLVDIAQFEKNLDELSTVLTQSYEPRGRVWVLSCFPCIDPVSDYYRRELNVRLQEFAAKCQGQYVDIYAKLDSVDPKRRRLYHDSLHLNVDGHRVVGDTIAEAFSATEGVI